MEKGTEPGHNTAAKVATFGMVTDQTETRWCPDCEIVGTYPTIPPEKEDGDGLDESVYDCDECGQTTEVYHPSMDHDRCRGCRSYIDEGAEYCEGCADADECCRDGCSSKAPWGDYCTPECEVEADG